MATSSCAHAPAPHSPQAGPMPAGILYEHADGRRAVVSSAEEAEFAADNPSFFRAGAVDILRVDAVASTVAPACKDKSSAPAFSEWGWIDTSEMDYLQRARADFLNQSRDLAHGAHTVAELLNWDEERSEWSDVKPTLSAYHRHSLGRLVIAALKVLDVEIEKQCAALEKEREHG